MSQTDSYSRSESRGRLWSLRAAGITCRRLRFRGTRLFRTIRVVVVGFSSFWSSCPRVLYGRTALTRISDHSATSGPSIKPREDSRRSDLARASGRLRLSLHDRLGLDVLETENRVRHDVDPGLEDGRFELNDLGLDVELVPGYRQASVSGARSTSSLTGYGVRTRRQGDGNGDALLDSLSHDLGFPAIASEVRIRLA